MKMLMFLSCFILFACQTKTDVSPNTNTYSDIIECIHKYDNSKNFSFHEINKQKKIFANGVSVFFFMRLPDYKVINRNEYELPNYQCKNSNGEPYEIK